MAMTTRRAPPKTVDPVYGNAPDVPPGATITRKHIAEDLPRVLRKAEARSKGAADWLSTEIERKQAEAWASSAHATVAAYMAPITEALMLASYGGQGNADLERRANVVGHARRMIAAGYKQHQLCAAIRRAIGSAWTTKHIREVLKAEGLWVDSPRK